MRRCISRIHSGQEGFTLVESVVALFIALTILTALSLTTISGYRAVRSTRGTQQATALGNEAIEAVRDLNYDELAMDLDADTTPDTAILTSCAGLTGSYFYKPGALNCEAIVTDGGGAINPHVTTETIGSETFTIKRYVTWADDVVQGGPQKSYKRVTAVVSWDASGTIRTYQTSTFMSNAQFGVPFPNFDVSPVEQARIVKQGHQVLFSHSITSLGVTDLYDVTVSGGRVHWIVEIYEDTNVIGELENGQDTELVDTNGNGVLDTGSLPTDETINLLLVWTLSTDPALEPLGDAEPVVLTVTSETDDTGPKTVKDFVEVTDTPELELFLHNNPTPPVGDTNRQKNTVMNPVEPTATTLYQYSKDKYTGAPGRWIKDDGANHSEGASDKMANWIYQTPEKAIYEGNAELQIWIANEDLACSPELSFNVYIREKSSGNKDNGTPLESFEDLTSLPSGDCNFRLYTLTFPFNRTIARNKWIELKVTVNDKCCGPPQYETPHGLFAYDTTTYASMLTLPQVSIMTAAPGNTEEDDPEDGS
ncbi:MAG: type IV pilus modification PilV family protein [Actinomycetota bacterium]